MLALTKRAGVAYSTYWYARTGRGKPNRRTLKALARALQAGPARRMPRRDLSMLIARIYDAYLGRVAAHLGFDPDEVRQNPSARTFWKARALALYLVSVGFNVTGADLGRAVGVSKQVVSWSLKQAEEMRDDPVIDGLAEETGKLLAEAAE